jgi:recombination protein RecR
MSTSSLNELINLFAKLPSLGPRSARRVVLYLLKKKNLIPQILESLSDVQSNIKLCENCGNIDVISPCGICTNVKRQADKICIIEDIADLWAIEKSNAFDGLYHVLGGVLSAIDGIGPEELNIPKLFSRLKDGNIKEIIIATNATIEGQITAQYIADQCDKSDFLVTRLAQGMPMGSELEILDYNTLSTAFKSRSKINTNP